MGMKLYAIFGQLLRNIHKAKMFSIKACNHVQVRILKNDFVNWKFHYIEFMFLLCELNAFKAMVFFEEILSDGQCLLKFLRFTWNKPVTTKFGRGVSF